MNPSIRCPRALRDIPAGRKHAARRAAALRERGHECLHVRDLGLGNAGDAEIARTARDLGAALVSRDLDFADVRRFDPSSSPGIVVLRVPDDDTAVRIAETLMRLVNDHSLLQCIAGRLAILEHDRVRFRPALD